MCWGGELGWGWKWRSPAQSGFLLKVTVLKASTVPHLFVCPPLAHLPSISPQGTSVSPMGQVVGTVGGDEGVDLSSDPPVSTCEMSATTLTLCVFICKMHVLVSSLVERIKWDAAYGDMWGFCKCSCSLFPQEESLHLQTIRHLGTDPRILPFVALTTYGHLSYSSHTCMFVYPPRIHRNSPALYQPGFLVASNRKKSRLT